MNKRSVDVFWNGLCVEAIVSGGGRGDSPGSIDLPEIEVLAVSIEDRMDHSDPDDARDLPDDLYRQLWEAAADDYDGGDY